jgi:hypothetical protein
MESREIDQGSAGRQETPLSYRASSKDAPARTTVDDHDLAARLIVVIGLKNPKRWTAAHWGSAATAARLETLALVGTENRLLRFVQRTCDGQPEIGDVHRHTSEHLAGGAFDVKKADQDVGGLNIGVPAAQREAVRSHQGALRTFREAECGCVALATGRSYQFGDLGPAGVQGGTCCSESLGCGMEAGVKQTQDDVLSSNVAMS